MLAGILFLASPKEKPKKKRPLGRCPLRGFLALLGEQGNSGGTGENRSINACPENNFSDNAQESAIEEIKGLLDEQYRKAFEETVMTSLERFKKEPKDSAKG